VTFVYILQCADGSYYTGWTTDLDRRVAAHNAGRGSRYTRARRPVKLVYWEDHPDRRSAQQRELRLKRLPRARKLALITSFQSANSPVCHLPTR
jgi:putative endonuclease